MCIYVYVCMYEYIYIYTHMITIVMIDTLRHSQVIVFSTLSRLHNIAYHYTI